MFVNQCSSGRSVTVPPISSKPKTSSEKPDTPSGTTWKAPSSKGVFGRRRRSAAECGAGKKSSLRLLNAVTSGFAQSSSETENDVNADPASPYAATTNSDGSPAG